MADGDACVARGKKGQKKRPEHITCTPPNSLDLLNKGWFGVHACVFVVTRREEGVLNQARSQCQR